jgi:copper oxidase (laccase) domain-containing protein
MIKFVIQEYGPQCILNAEEGKISLHKIIEAQCKKLGILDRNISWDEFDTATDKNPDGSFRWWSNRRGEKGRNLVLVRMV